MKSLPSALLALVLVPGAASQQASSSTSTAQASAQQTGAEKSQPSSPDAVLEHSMPSMALILTGDGTGNPIPAACAFIRRPDGILLTTYQAVKNVRQLRVMLANGQAYEKVEVIASDERRNVGALRVQATGLPVLPAGASEELKTGDTVYALYGSAATAWVIVPGLFHAVRMSDEVSGAGRGYRLLEFTPPVAPRLSGGVLLDSQGHALGMLVSFPGVTNAGYAVPLESIAGLADASPATLPTQSVGAVPPPPPFAPQNVSAPKPPEPTPETKMPIEQPLSKNADPADVLRGFKTYYIKSDTIYLHRETLQKEFQNRKEFAAWGVTETQDAKTADVLITITLPFMSWEWNYRMVYQVTGKVLGAGKVSAAVEKTAAPQLAAMMVDRIREARPLPDSFHETEATLQAQPNPKAETGKSWQVNYVSGSIANLAQNSSVKLTVNHDWVAVRASKTAWFSLPAPKIASIVSSNEVRKATSGWDQFWETSFNKLGCADDSCGALLLLPAIPVILAGHGVLAPMRATDHFVTIYWMEDGAVKSAEFSASVDDAKSLIAELNKATGKSALDIQESIKKRKTYIEKAFYNSPVVDIKKKVSLGWSTLAPGEYRLILNPSASGFAEVYFYPAQRESFDIDLVKESVAEYEVRRTRLETPGIKVSYREQNGMLMLDKIEAREFTLRFTPVPLGSPN